MIFAFDDKAFVKVPGVCVVLLILWVRVPSCRQKFDWPEGAGNRSQE